LKRIAFIAIVLTAILLYCKNEAVSSPSGTIDPTFSGKWRGSSTIYKAGQCSIGGGDSTTNSTTMTWTVNTAGDITIQDSVLTTANWTGKIQTNLSISLRKILTINCNGTQTTDTTFYNGTVIKESATYKLNVESVESWCPQRGCVFRVRYAITKQQ
jgi:hypothetical protein